MRVLRDSKNNLLKVDDVFYQLSELVDRTFDIAKQHSSNPVFDMPGWFYSGSPYADEIHKLGCESVENVNEFIPEFVPPLGKVWRSREPMWPTIFGCEVKNEN
jgi:hypothetical protein